MNICDDLSCWLPSRRKKLHCMLFCSVHELFEILYLTFLLDRCTMSMALCYWFSWYSSLLLFVWQLWGHTSCWMLRTIIGSGPHSSLLPQRRFMYTCIQFITTMWRLKCRASSRQASILDTLLCFALVLESSAVRLCIFFSHIFPQYYAGGI